MSQLFSRTLDICHLPGSHTSENISNALFDVLKDWNLSSKLVSLVTDNAKNMTNIKVYLMDSMRHLNHRITDINHLGCLAHILNLIVKKITKIEVDNELDNDDDDNDSILDDAEKTTIKSYKFLVQKCRNIASLFHQSSLVSEVFEEKQKTTNLKSKKIIQDVQTRFNSTFLMLERFQEQTDIVNETLRDRKFNNKYDHFVFSTDDVKILNEAVIILQPFFDATNELSGVKYPTLSIVIPILLSLKQLLQSDPNDSMFSLIFKRYLLHHTENYIVKYNILNIELLITATYLDLRTKMFAKCSDLEKKTSAI